MGLSVLPYEDDGAARVAWDGLVATSWNGTFLHTRRFLSYHGGRFIDRSLTVKDGDKLLAVLPAASVPGESETVVSHPGATYGGLVHAGGLGGSSMQEALRLAAEAWAGAGCRRLVYKSVPSFYHRVRSEEDTYWFWRAGARVSRVDLSALVPLAVDLPPSTDRRRGHKRALAQGLSVVSGPEHTQAFWRILTENLASRHQAKPVHSAEEMLDLMARFPDDIHLDVALAAGTVVAGAVHFRAGAALHCQYSAASAEGRRSGALDLLFQTAIQRARDAGLAVFDFGISNEAQGRVLNEALYRFKASFAGASAVHTFFEADLATTIGALQPSAEAA
ncbi:MAG: GNAT family N-acetyltransferase [Thermoplasmatota archaeon]